MTTATKPKQKTPDVLAELEELREAHEAAEQEASVRGREHVDALNRWQELQRERAGLVRREPGLVDHRGHPLDTIDDNPVAAIDAAISKVGDVADLQARRDHARRIAERVKADVDGYVRDNYDAVMEATRPLAEADIEAVAEATRPLIEALGAYIGRWHRAVAYVVAVGGDTRTVPDIDRAHRLRETLEELELPLVVPR